MSTEGNTSHMSQDDLISYVQDSLNTIEKLENKNHQLEEKVATLESEKVELEKVASTSSFSLDEERVSSMVDELEKLSFVTSEGKQQLKDFIYEDPTNLVNVVTKVATLAMESPASGSGVTKISDTPDNNDPYGWKEFLSVKPTY